MKFSRSADLPLLIGYLFTSVSNSFEKPKHIVWLLGQMQNHKSIISGRMSNLIKFYVSKYLTHFSLDPQKSNWQTVQTLISYCNMWHLIRVSTVYK